MAEVLTKDSVSSEVLTKDAIIGTIDNYAIPHIAPYVLSLEKSGFNGDRYMVCYNINKQTLDFLREYGFTVFTYSIDSNGNSIYNYKPNHHVCVERFNSMWFFLSKIKTKYRYLISTDVGDVVFQKNPSEWLSKNFDSSKSLNAASEGILYKNETLWGANNMQESFGEDALTHIGNTCIYNAGTISGKFETVRDMFLTIYTMCQGYKTKNPDQSAYNLLLSLEPYKSLTQFNSSETMWACQIGTTCEPERLKTFEKHLLEPKPIFNIDNGSFTNKEGELYTIVHQYVRTNEMHQAVFRRFVN